MNTTEEQLIVLRFRDIELPSGETIARHKRTIAEKGFCWWGWLFRDYERNPHAELSKVAKLVTETSPLAIALFDTGRGMIFRARCIEIRSSSNQHRSPEAVATPAYYNDRRAPAWFKLTEIVDADKSWIIGKTCVAMPSASDDCFVDLLGQSVTHLRDLRRQEVTLWMLG